MHGRSKHIDVQFHFLQDLTKDGVTDLVPCGSKVQLAHFMMKPLKFDMFLKIREQLGICIGQKYTDC